MYILIENIKAGVTCLPPLSLDWEKCKLTKAVLKDTAFGEACLASKTWQLLALMGLGFIVCKMRVAK